MKKILNTKEHAKKRKARLVLVGAYHKIKAKKPIRKEQPKATEELIYNPYDHKNPRVSQACGVSEILMMDANRIAEMLASDINDGRDEDGISSCCERIERRLIHVNLDNRMLAIVIFLLTDAAMESVQHKMSRARDTLDTLASKGVHALRLNEKTVTKILEDMKAGKNPSETLESLRKTQEGQPVSEVDPDDNGGHNCAKCPVNTLCNLPQNYVKNGKKKT